MPVSQSAFCWPKFVLGREFPGHNRAPIWLTLVLLVGRRIKALSGKVFSLAVNAESPRKFPPPSVLVTISRKECLERCELATYAKHFRLLLRPLLPPRPRKLFRLSKCSTHPPHPQVSLSLPMRLPYSRSSTFAQLCSPSPQPLLGLFGYRPSLLQQCARTESFHFVSTVTRAVNVLASGNAPMFLQPFLAGGVSIALAKPNRGVRPLCCGDPLRRLVAKCFCLGGKGEISRGFKGKNFGVGCPGGVEAVAHFLRDVLLKYRNSELALLKIDSRMPSTSSTAKPLSKLFPGLEKW